MEWSDPVERTDFVKAETRLAMSAAADARSRVEAAIALSAARTQSPIEAKFAAWFNAACSELLAGGHLRFALRLRPQAWVECDSGQRYRLDFSLEPREEWLRCALIAANLPIKIAIELDGHEFHERTAEQVARRNCRDRDLMAAGWHVFHYSGSELWQNPMRAATEVLTAGADALDAAKCTLLESNSTLGSVRQP